MAATHAHRITRIERDMVEVKTSIASIAQDVSRLTAFLSDASPATVTPKASPAKKAPAKKATTRKPKAAAKPATKGAQTRETLSRKDWNRTLTTKARLGGRLVGGQSVYSAVLADWAFVTGLRNEGMTPDEAIAFFIA